MKLKKNKKSFFCWGKCYFLLKLLLGADVVGVTAGLLTAVGGTRGEAGVALTADLLVPVVLLGEGDEGGFHDTTAEFEFEFEFTGHFFLREEKKNAVFCVVLKRACLRRLKRTLIIMMK